MGISTRTCRNESRVNQVPSHAVSTKTPQQLSGITIATENGVAQHPSKFHTNINLCLVFKVCGAAPTLCASKCQNFPSSSLLGQQLTV